MVLLLGYGYGTARSQTDTNRVPQAPSRVWAANNFLSNIMLPSEGLKIFNFRDYNPLEAVIDSADLLIEEARLHLGKPYRYGGKGPKAFDPSSLLEAARIDGAGEFRIWWKIVMPSVKPAWLTVIIFAFQNIWNNNGNLYIYNESMKVLPSIMSQVQAGGLARTGATSAVILVMMLPPIILFTATQRQSPARTAILSFILE